MKKHWGDFVAEKVASKGELVLGIDPVLEDLPFFFKQNGTPAAKSVQDYVHFLLETTADQIGFVKYQSAFFEAFGTRGIGVLSYGIAQAKEIGLGVILDAKRGDVESTARSLCPGVSDARKRQL